MTADIWIGAVIGIAAIVEDIARRQISNWMPVAAFAGGVAYHTATRGWMGLGSALAGALGGFLVFLIFYILGGMGGGDVKLMGGFGAVLGLSRLLQGALFTALIGAAIAIGVIAWRALAKSWRKQGVEGKQPESIPYAPAIALGVFLALIPG